jgi:HK97 family phage prohead protease
MNEVIIRAVQPDTVEFEGSEGRTLHARLFKWNTISRVQDVGRPPYDEEWMRGVFAQSIRSIERSKRGWPLMYNHGMQTGVPLGVVSMVHERDDGPWMTSKISRTTFGDDLIELIKDGAVPGVSVRGRNIKSRRNDANVVQRMEVAIEEVSVTPFPQLIGADELVLRAQQAEAIVVARTELSDFLSNLQKP